MNSARKRVIRGYAAGRNDYRDLAISAYRSALRDGEPTDTPWMLFMAEIDCPVPDLALRARYREMVKNEPIL